LVMSNNNLVRLTRCCFYDLSSHKVLKLVGGKLRTWLSCRRLGRLMESVAKLGGDPSGVDPRELAKAEGISRRTAGQYLCILRKLASGNCVEVRAEGIREPTSPPLRGWRRKPFCSFHRACPYQSMRVVNARNGRAVHIPYCLWSRTCNMQAMEPSEAAERRAELCRKFGLRYCPICLSHHL